MSLDPLQSPSFDPGSEVRWGLVRDGTREVLPPHLPSPAPGTSARSLLQKQCDGEVTTVLRVNHSQAWTGMSGPPGMFPRSPALCKHKCLGCTYAAASEGWKLPGDKVWEGRVTPEGHPIVQEEVEEEHVQCSGEASPAPLCLNMGHPSGTLPPSTLRTFRKTH